MIVLLCISYFWFSSLNWRILKKSQYTLSFGLELTIRNSTAWSRDVIPFSFTSCTLFLSGLEQSPMEMSIKVSLLGSHLLLVRASGKFRADPDVD
jgi:hypothetical protein